MWLKNLIKKTFTKPFPNKFNQPKEFVREELTNDQKVYSKETDADLDRAQENFNNIAKRKAELEAIDMCAQYKYFDENPSKTAAIVPIQLLEFIDDFKAPNVEPITVDEYKHLRDVHFTNYKRNYEQSKPTKYISSLCDNCYSKLQKGLTVDHLCPNCANKIKSN